MAARASFDSELTLLHTDLIKMGAMAEEAVGDAIQAFRTKDNALAQQIIEHDRAIDDLEKAIEARCLSLLLRQQPVAADLRAISTALKMITDIERIGDGAADIADLVTRIDGDNIFDAVEDIPQMAAIACEMVRDSITAFVESDLELARAVMKRDDQVDDLFNKVKKDLAALFVQPGDHIDRAIDFLMIAKYLERIGDHAVNIGEWVEFYQTGEHKKHKIIG